MRLFNVVTIFGAVVGAVFVSQAQATLVTWGTPTNISGPSDVSTNGTVFQTLDISSTTTGVLTQTVNGVPFLSAKVFGTATQSWTPNVSMSGMSGPGYYGGFLGSATTGDTSYDAILKTGMYNATGTLTVTNLAASTQYEIQVWANDARAGIGNLRNLTFKDEGGGALVTLKQSVSSGALGEYAIGTFTTDNLGSDLILAVAGTTPTFNAMQIRTIPEPSSFLFGLVVLGLGMTVSFVQKRYHNA